MYSSSIQSFVLLFGLNLLKYFLEERRVKGWGRRDFWNDQSREGHGSWPLLHECIMRFLNKLLLEKAQEVLGKTMVYIRNQ